MEYGIFEMTGVIWIGLADHFFNNTIINILHIKTDTGFDVLQTVQALIAQLKALVLISVIYVKRLKRILKLKLDQI